MDAIWDIFAAADRALYWVPPWVVALAVLAACTLAAHLLHWGAFRLVTRTTAGWSLFWRSLISRTRAPTRFAFIIAGLMIGSWIAPLDPSQTTMLAQVLFVFFVFLVAWCLQTALHIWVTLYLRRFKLDADDNLLARKHVTQSRILVRAANIVIFILAIAVALMTFEAVRQYGVSLLAAGGAAGIIVGLALQPVLKNLFAGIQLAVTQPIRIDDAVIVEGEWGNIEEITATYVVVRIWDLRRLILPLSYFIENPFQNWTREGAALLGVVLLYLDYRALGRQGAGRAGDRFQGAGDGSPHSRIGAQRAGCVRSAL